MVGLGPNPGSCSAVAVIVLGMQTGIELDPNRLKSMEIFTSLARMADALIIWCSMTFRKKHPEVGEDNKYLKVFNKTGKFDTAEDGQSLDLQIDTYDIDILLRIVRFDAFFSTELDCILRARKIDTVVVIGAGTETFILHTALHACNLDYRVFVLRDACFSLSKDSGEALMKQIFPITATVHTMIEFGKLYRL